MRGPSSLRERDRLDVIDENGDERTVFGWATIERAKRIRGSNPVVEAFEPTILGRDGIPNPDAVTHWVAEEIQNEERVDVTEHGIDVIDPTDDEVDVL